MSNILELNDNNFENEVNNQKVPVLVDFWATWCGPCRKIAPLIEELSEEYSGKIKFVKIKADENPSTAQKYSVIGVPCLLLIKESAPVERMLNIRNKNDIKKVIDRYTEPSR